MSHDDFKQRTKAFALRVIKRAEALPPGLPANVIGKQLVRSATSVAANYRTACRAKSPADFIAKLGIVAAAADETMLWLELLVESGLVKKERLADLHNEAD